MQQGGQIRRLRKGGPLQPRSLRESIRENPDQSIVNRAGFAGNFIQVAGRRGFPRHGGIDENSLEIRAAEFTTSDVGDAPMLPELLSQIPTQQEIATVTADGAFDTRKCHDAIAARGAAAIISPSKNAKPWKPDNPGAVARNEILRTSKRVWRIIWRRWSGYHRRSRAETKMHCVKLLGQRLSARDFDRQVAEFQVRVAVLNGFTALGIPVTEVAG